MTRSALLLSASLLAGLAATSASAAIVRLSEAAFLPTAGLITFSEFGEGTVAPTYNPADYSGGAGAPIVTFAGYFQGQSLSATPAIDCPGAAATGCIVGNPTGPLALDMGSPMPFITADGANPTSPVLSGAPRFNGPIALLFSLDQAGVGFDAGFFDDIGSTGITAFDRQGNLIGTVVNEGNGIEFLGLVTGDGLASIAGVFLDLVGAESAGFAIDNVRFGQAGDIIIPPPVGAVPLPAALPLLGAGIGALAMMRRRRRSA